MLFTPVAPPRYLTISQSENGAQNDHRPYKLSPSSVLKMPGQNPSVSLGPLEHGPRFSLLDPTINLSPLQTLTFQFV